MIGTTTATTPTPVSILDLRGPAQDELAADSEAGDRSSLRRLFSNITPAAPHAHCTLTAWRVRQVIHLMQVRLVQANLVMDNGRRR